MGWQKMTDKSVHSFSIIKHFNSLNDAVTLDGYTVRREEKLFFSQIGRFVLCASYDTHFLYIDPLFIKGVVGRWSPMCTCGSAGALVGYNVYKQDASPSGGSGLVPGELLVCMTHAQTGRHNDGVQ